MRLKITLVVVLALLGVSIYDSIAIRIRPKSDVATARAIADRIRAERDDYKLRLDDATGRVSELEDILREAEQTSNSLKSEFDRSQNITGKLHSDNIRIADQLESSRTDAGILRDENSRLGDKLDQSRESGNRLRSTTSEIAKAVDSIEDIIRRYPEPTGTK